jgi:membrane protein
MNFIRSAGKLLFDTYQKWRLDSSPRLAAALAYYTLFSLSPLLIILVAVLGRLLGTNTVRDTIVIQIATFAGPEIADFIGGLIGNISSPRGGEIATVVSIGVILWGASSVFNHLKESLNIIWGVRPEESRSILIFIRTRVLAFLAVFALGLVIALYFGLTTLFATIVPLMATFLPDMLPQILPAWRIIQWASLFLGFVLLLVVFAIIFKVFPDVEMTWHDVGVGALVTAILSSAGNTAISYYISRASIGSAFGAASSLLVILVWLYYSAQIFLYGAEFTYVYANRYGSKVVLAGYARKNNAGTEAPVPEKKGLALLWERLGQWWRQRRQRRTRPGGAEE